MFDKKSLRKNIYQNSFWKTNLHPGNFYPKKIEGTSPKNLCTETFTEKKGHSPSIAKKNLHLKIQEKMFEKKPEQETVYQKNSEESLPKNIWREISTKEISEETSPPRKYSIWREFSTKKKRTSDKKIKYYLPKKFCRKILAFFFKRNLYETTSEEIFVRQSPWREISTKKMSEETFLPKSLKRHLQQRIWEEKSLAKNLSRQKSTKSLKRNLYQSNPPETVPKFLSREIFTKQAFERFFFTRNC